VSSSGWAQILAGTPRIQPLLVRVEQMQHGIPSMRETQIFSHSNGWSSSRC
jgi:hypothetical protein